MTIGSVTTATAFPSALSSLADAAAGYAALGWRVFPCKPGAKTPLYPRAHADDDTQRACPGGHVCGRLGHGFKDGSADPGRVARWWAREPRANIGVATGGTSPDVLDVDVKGDAPGRESFDLLRRCGYVKHAWAAAVTPSGGWHYFFDGTPQASATLKKKGVDFRSTGGYVLVDPSVVLTGGQPRRYRWSWVDLAHQGILDWGEIRDFLVPPPPPRNLMHTAFADGASPIVDWFVREAMTVGNRNNALYWAACRILESGYGEASLLQLHDEAVLCGLDRPEVRKTIASARRHVLGGGV